MPPSCPSRRVQRARTLAGTLAAPKRLVPASPEVRLAPPPFQPDPRPLPVRLQAASRLEPSLRADGATRRLPFRPRGLAPPRRFPPRSGPRACCISLPAMGFVAFSGFPCPIASPSRPPKRSMGAARYTVAVLATLTPSEESPSPSAAPRHRGRCLPAVSARVRPASNDLPTAALGPHARRAWVPPRSNRCDLRRGTRR